MVSKVDYMYSTYDYKNINGEVIFKKSILGNKLYVRGWYKDKENKWKLDPKTFISGIPRNEQPLVGISSEVKLMLYNIEKVREAISQGKDIIFVENELDTRLLTDNGYCSICLSNNYFENKELIPLLQILKDGNVYIIKQFIQKLVKHEEKKEVTTLLKTLIKVSKTVNEIDLQYDNYNYNNIIDIFLKCKTDEEGLEIWRKILENSKKLK